jgi:hypothetical protein
MLGGLVDRIHRLGILSEGDFFGEGALAGQILRMGSAASGTIRVFFSLAKDQTPEWSPKQIIRAEIA